METEQEGGWPHTGFSRLLTAEVYQNIYIFSVLQNAKSDIKTNSQGCFST